MKPVFRTLTDHPQRCTEIKAAVALLVNSELWGFVTPKSVDVDSVISAAKQVQPYYAVPTQFVALDDLPYTRYARSQTLSPQLTIITVMVKSINEPSITSPFQGLNRT